jgi:hypothetical protein
MPILLDIYDLIIKWVVIEIDICAIFCLDINDLITDKKPLSYQVKPYFSSITEHFVRLSRLDWFRQSNETFGYRGMFCYQSCLVINTGKLLFNNRTFSYLGVMISHLCI